jgi:nucleoside-triphosphatase THEP1
MSYKNIFVTGPPRCGKSTLIEKLVQKIGKPMTGFYTREIKEEGKRVGFSITTLDGKTGILAHRSFKSRYRVGRYGVKLEDIDQIAVPSLIPAQSDQIVVIDEVGKMECFSPLFRQALVKVLDSKQTILGSIALKGDRFIHGLKERDDLILVHLDEENRDRVLQALIDEYF